MKVYCTKFAMTNGIEEIDGEISPRDPQSLVYYRGKSRMMNFLHGEGKEWHINLQSALAKADLMRMKKIDSLKQQIKKLEKMNFE